MGSSLLVMANAAIAPSLATLGQVFKSSFGVSLLMSLPAVAVVLFSPFVNRLIQRYGERRVLLSGLLLYASAGSCGLWSHSLAVLWVGRLLLGVAIAICMTLINHLIGSLFQGERRTRFVAQQSIAVNLGGVIFVLASGALAQVSWRLPFSLYLLSLPVFFLALFSVKSLPKHPICEKFNYGLLRSVMPLYFLGGLGMFIYYLVLIHIPFDLSTNFGLSAGNIGILMALMSLISATCAGFYQRLKHRFGQTRLLVICFIFLSLAIMPFAVVTPTFWLMGTLLCAGIGFGLLLPTLTHMVIDISPARHRPGLLSGFVMAYFLGQALSAPMLKLVSVNIQQGFFIFIAATGILAGIYVSWIKTNQSHGD
ncbi:MFS transporter [Buttiauxella gaviniae]|uniref:MFS transporter n=1 Tax=Buttiauxella gaviniae TaxID=82990 RepID=A0ABV3NP20_9ENTR